MTKSGSRGGRPSGAPGRSPADASGPTRRRRSSAYPADNSALTGTSATSGSPYQASRSANASLPHSVIRIGPVGYSTDVVDLDDTAFAALAGIELWVVDCLRREPHPTHANLGKVLGWVERLRPGRTVLTHMDQSLDYGELSAELPAGVEPGHDGLIVELPDS